MNVTSRRLEREAAIEHDAAVVFAHLRRSGVRFDAARKVESAADFSLREGGSALAFPTKLHGTSAFQTAAANFAAGRFGRVGYRRLICRRVPDERPGRAGLFRLALHVEGCRLGFLADKHAGWLLPLLRFNERGALALSGVEFYALAVTGGTAGKPMRGVNVCLTGLAARLRAVYGIAPGGPEDEPSANHYAAEMEAEALLAAQEEAYGSADAARVHALTDAEFARSEHAA